MKDTFDATCQRKKSEMGFDPVNNMQHILRALVTFIAVTIIAACASADEVASILIVGSKPDHPYGSHMYEFEGKLLAHCLSKHMEVAAEFVSSWPPTDEQLESARSIVFYSSPAGSVLLLPEHQKRFDSLMQKKVGFVALHWGTGIGYDQVSNPPEHRELFKSWLGGLFRRPPCDIKVDEAKLRMVAEDHPVGRGWTDSVIRDEFYLNPVLHEEAKPLLQVKVDDKEQVVGWTFERAGQGGRSVGLTLGHFHHNFARDDFRRLLVNSVLWSADVEVPQKGADVEVEENALKLPEPAKAE